MMWYMFPLTFKEYQKYVLYYWWQCIENDGKRSDKEFVFIECLCDVNWQIFLRIEIEYQVTPLAQI